MILLYAAFGEDEFQDLSKFIEVHPSGSERINDLPGSFSFSLVPLTMHNDVTPLPDINSGDVFAICWDESLTECVVKGVVYDPGRKPTTYSRKLGKPIFRYNIKCIQEDFSASPIDKLTFSQTMFSDIVRSILDYSDESLGDENITGNHDKFILNFPDFEVDGWSIEKSPGPRASLTDLCEYFDSFWVKRYFSYPDEDKVAKFTTLLEISNRSGLPPTLENSFYSGITDEHFKTNLVDNPITENSVNYPSIPGHFDFDIKENTSVIVNSVEVSCNIYDGGTTESLTRFEINAELNIFNYDLKFIASDIPLIAFLVQTKCLASSTSSVVRLPSRNAVTIEIGNTALFPDYTGDIKVISPDQLFTVTGVNKVNSTYTEVSFSPALPFTPAENDAFEIVGNVDILEDNQANDGGNEHGVCINIEKSKNTTIKFLKYSEPPPGVVIVGYAKKIRPEKNIAINDESIQKYGLKHKEIKLDDDIVLTSIAADNFASNCLILIPEFSFTIKTRQYGLAHIGLLVGINITDWIKENFILTQMSWQSLGNKDFQKQNAVVQTLEFSTNTRNNDKYLKGFKKSRKATTTSQVNTKYKQLEKIRVQDKVRFAVYPLSQKFLITRINSGTGKSQIFLMYETGESIQITDGLQDDIAPKWNKALKANKIYFMRYDIGTGLYRLCRCDLDGSNLEDDLLANQRLIDYNFSTDYEKLALCIDEATAGVQANLYISDKNGGSLAMLTYASVGVSITHPLWNSLNDTIGFNDNYAMYVFYPGGSGEFLQGDSQVFDWKNNTELLMSDNGNGFTDFDLFTKVVLDGISGAKTYLTFDNRKIYSAKYNPEKTKIAYSALVSGYYQIFIIDADGSNQAQLTTGNFNYYFFNFNFNGKKIIYTKVVSGKRLIFSMKPDGNSKTQLSITGKDDILSDIGKTY